MTLLRAPNEHYRLACRIWDEAEPEHEDLPDLRETWMFAEIVQAVAYADEDPYNTGRDALADLMGRHEI